MNLNITPHLWFDTQAKEAVNFYVDLFSSVSGLPRSKVSQAYTIHNVPSPTGDSDILSFELAGMPFMAINAGPIFKFNPAISFFLNFDPSKLSDAETLLDQVWHQLLPGGTVLMELGKYPFSSRYGWIQDKYGVSWQLILTNPAGDPHPFIVPSLLFTGPVAGQAETAANFYLSVFKDSQLGQVNHYPTGHAPNKEGTVMYMDYRLGDTWFAAMDSAYDHKFTFTEAISLVIPCQSQAEIDYYWTKLSSDPASEQCGWLKDKFGVSWQVWPVAIGEMMGQGTPSQLDALTQALLPMKKLEIEPLKAAFDKAK